MRQLLPTIRQAWLYQQPGTDAAAIAVGSAAWRAWLEEHDSFRYDAAPLLFTARKEKRPGGYYWYAYRREHGKLCTAYLGRSAEITMERLGKVARNWQHEAAPAASTACPQRDGMQFGADCWNSPRRTMASACCGLLPTVFSSFVGRERELATVTALLRRSDVRLVSLIGPGGVGKTRLALHVAADLHPTGDIEVHFFSLAAERDSNLILEKIAQHLDHKTDSAMPAGMRIAGALQQRRVLLILDNFEQVGEYAALLSDLLAACPGLKLLITSRVMLHLSVEYAFRVTPLAYPAPDDPLDDTLVRYPAVDLFTQRARAVVPDLALNATNLRAIGAICARFDGLPLAIELVAARAGFFSPALLAARLAAGEDVPVNGGPDMPARQQTLRATFAWSYDLLGAVAQRTLRALAVFSGGCSLAAAEWLLASLQGADSALLETITALVDASMLEIEQRDGVQPRLRMLDSIRFSARQLLDLSGATAIVRESHARYYLRLAEQAEHALYGREQTLWLDQFASDSENFRTAYNFWLECGPRQKAAFLAGVMGHCYYRQGRLCEAMQLLRPALDCGAAASYSPGDRHALYIAGLAACFMGREMAALAWAAASAAQAQAVSDSRGLARAWSLLLLSLLINGQCEQAQSQLSRTIAMLGVSSDPAVLGEVFQQCAMVATYEQDYERAAALYGTSIAHFEEVGDYFQCDQLRWLLAGALFAEGDEARAMIATRDSSQGHERAAAWLLCAHGAMIRNSGNQQLAHFFLAQAAQLFQDLADQEGKATVALQLARLALWEADREAAQSRALDTVRLARAVNDQELIAACLDGLARDAAAQGYSTWAVQLWGAAARQNRAHIQAHPGLSVDHSHQPEAKIRALLGEQEFDAAWSLGWMLTPEQVITTDGAPIRLQRDGTTDHKRETMLAGRPAGLTGRELEVLLLIAAGCANDAIARRLVISSATVRTYVSAIYKKLQVSSRPQAMRYAIDHDLSAKPAPD